MQTAFATCDLPVILSLEMHCGLKQQRAIADLRRRQPPPRQRITSPHEIAISPRQIGGFCAVSEELPLTRDAQLTRRWAAEAEGPGGANVRIGRTVHCLAAEPHATFIRVAVSDCHGGTEVAFETAVRRAVTWPLRGRYMAVT